MIDIDRNSSVKKKLESVVVEGIVCSSITDNGMNTIKL
jgi:hypothetical protein